MAYVAFSDLSVELQQQAVELRPEWDGGDFPRFEFWVTKAGRISRAPGHHRMTESAADEFMRRLWAPVRSKTDLLDWKSGPTFHLSRD
jgi:hypothetical protein